MSYPACISRQSGIDMKSQDILEGYLDKELMDVLGETTLQNIITKETQGALSETEVQIVAALIQRRHDEVSMERVRRNISLLEFGSVLSVDSTFNSVNHDNDNEIVEFISQLDRLNNILDENIEKAKSTRDEKLNQLKINMKTLMDSKSLQKSNNIDDTELQNITKEINDFNSYMLKLK